MAHALFSVYWIPQSKKTFTITFIIIIIIIIIIHRLIHRVIRNDCRDFNNLSYTIHLK